jgi:flavin-dependent dehydrogenase
MTAVDALVVGAGPAGSVTALMLARAGMRVRLLDRARFPRPKLCGDTLNPGALALLAHLDRRGFAPELSQRIRARALPLRGMTVSGPDGSSVTADYPDDVPGLAISRGELDALLLESAAAANADVLEGVRAVTPVIERGRVCGIDVQGRSNETWRAAHVIVADGRGSRLAASLQLSQFAPAPRRWAFGAYFSGVSGVGSHGEMHLRRNGYIGVAPLPGGLTNVCVVRPLAHLATHRVDRRAVILDAVRGDRWLARRFDAARQESELRILGPLAVDGRAAGCPGAVLAGDVAGFVDPMTGDGLRFAIGGGMLAAEAVLTEAATGRAAFAVLAVARRRAFGGKYRFNRALRLLTGSPRALTAATWLSDRWPLPAEVIIRTAGDVQHAQPASPLDLSSMRLQSRVG